MIVDDLGPLHCTLNRFITFGVFSMRIRFPQVFRGVSPIYVLQIQVHIPFLLMKVEPDLFIH